MTPPNFNTLYQIEREAAVRLALVSPYLRRASLPSPPYIPGDRVLTGFGLGVVTRTFWHSVPNNEPHWRCSVRLVDGGAIPNCAARYLRRPAILAVDEYMAAAE